LLIHNKFFIKIDSSTAIRALARTRRTPNPMRLAGDLGRQYPVVVDGRQPTQARHLPCAVALHESDGLRPPTREVTSKPHDDKARESVSHCACVPVVVCQSEQESRAHQPGQRAQTESIQSRQEALHRFALNWSRYESQSTPS